MACERATSVQMRNRTHLSICSFLFEKTPMQIEDIEERVVVNIRMRILRLIPRRAF